MTERAFPVPDNDTQPFWDGVRAGVLRIQRCRDCDRHVFYPRAVCPHCGGGRLDWVDASGMGRVHSFTVVHRAPNDYRDEAPYVVALVDLAEGVRMMTRLVDVEPGQVSVGMPVQLAAGGEPALPFFRPV